ncbi:MAG: DUF6456 domain-containing protein [Terricaulis sp.]
MSARSAERALGRLTAPGAILAPEGDGYAVFAKGDRRRRPSMRLPPHVVRELETSGAIGALADGAFALTQAGRARVRRGGAEVGEQYLAQHADVVSRHVAEAAGVVRPVRGLELNPSVRRLGALRGASGAPWLSGAELAAAARLRNDWEIGQSGLVRGSDWSAAPKGGGRRGPGSALEGAMAFHCDARRRVADDLASMAPPLRRVVERICLYDDGLEALERAEGWPARSCKLALKLGLAQLAMSH